MNNQLQKTQKYQLSPPVQELARGVFNYNYLTAFPLLDAMLESFAMDINRFWPWMTEDTLSLIFDEMKLGRIDFEPKLGFQNISKAIESYMANYCYIYNTKTG